MCGIHGNGREKQLDRPGVEIFNVLASLGAQIAPYQDANRFGLQRRNQIVAPALILLVHETVNFRGEFGEDLFRYSSVGTGLAIPVLGLLHQAGKAHLDELVQIARGNAQKFHTLQERITWVTRLFENPLIELHPGQMAIEESLGVRNGDASHARV